MKKLFNVVVICLALLSFSACSSNSTTYLLEYKSGSFPVIMNTNKNGLFYILENPINLKSEFGEITIDSCHYEDGLGYTFYYTLTTDRPDIIEKMIKEEELNIYGKTFAIGKALDLISYGYNVYTNGHGNNLTRFEFFSGYERSSHSQNQPLQFEILNVSCEIKLTEKQGFSIDTIQGKRLWDKIS